jgi:hypothetical protein
LVPFFLSLFYFITLKSGTTEVYGWNPIYIVEFGGIFLFLYFWAGKWIAPLIISSETVKKSSPPPSVQKEATSKKVSSGSDKKKKPKNE